MQLVYLPPRPSRKPQIFLNILMPIIRIPTRQVRIRIPNRIHNPRIKILHMPVPNVPVNIVWRVDHRLDHVERVYGRVDFGKWLAGGEGWWWGKVWIDGGLVEAVVCRSDIVGAV